MLAPLLGKISKEEEKRAGQKLLIPGLYQTSGSSDWTKYFFSFSRYIQRFTICPNAVNGFFSFLTFIRFPFDENSEWENNCEKSKLSFCATVRPAERPIMQQVSRENTPIVIIVNINITKSVCTIAVTILARQSNNPQQVCRNVLRTNHYCEYLG